MMETIKIIDVSNWAYVMETDEGILFAAGKRKKKWIISPEPEKMRYQLKIPAHGLGEVWSEYVCCEVGKQLGLNIAEIELAKCDGSIGIISRNFLESKNGSFIPSDVLMERFYPGFIRTELDMYTIENIFELLEKISDIYECNLKNEFIKVLLFDALIANQDRHCENWGILIQLPNHIKLAPIYDHGSCLGFNNFNSSNPRSVDIFTNRSKTIFGMTVDGVEKKKVKLTYILNYLYGDNQVVFEEFFKALRTLDNQFMDSLLKSLPDEIIKAEERVWVKDLIQYRKEWLVKKEWLKGE